MNLGSYLSILPERFRPLAAAFLTLVFAVVALCSVLNTLIPTRYLSAPGLSGAFVRLIHRLAALRGTLESGTLKLPGAGPAAASDERAALLARLAELGPPVDRPTTAPPAPRGSPGRATVSVLLVLALSAPLAVACHPQPSPSGPPTTVSGWVDTARTVLTTLEWAVPASRAIVVSVLPGPAAMIVGRVLDGVTDAAGRLSVALDAYTARGGDRCAIYAAAGGVHAALVQTAQALADNGIALGVVLEHVADAVGSLLDNLIPSCDQRDAGWSSAGDRINVQLRLIERAATQRGVILRRDLDAIRPAGAR